MKKYLISSIFLGLIGLNTQNTLGIANQEEKAFKALTHNVSQWRNTLRFGGRQIWYLNALGASMIKQAANIANTLNQINLDDKTKIDNYMNSLIANFETTLVKSATQHALEEFNKKAQEKIDFLERPEFKHMHEDLQERFLGQLLRILNQNYTKIIHALQKLKATSERLPKQLTVESLKAIVEGNTDFSDEY